jgi:hypothetical protein
MRPFPDVKRGEYWNLIKSEQFLQFCFIFSPWMLLVLYGLWWSHLGARSSVIGWGTVLQDGGLRVLFSVTSLNVFNLCDSSSRTRPCSWLSLQQEWVPGIFLGLKVRPARRADNSPPLESRLSRTGVPKVCAAAPWGAVKSKQGRHKAPLISLLRNLNLLRHSLNIVTGDQFPVTQSLS